MQKNILRKKITLFALVAILLFEIVTSVFLTTAAADTDEKNIYTTSIEEDFDALGIDSTLYPANANGIHDMIWFTEFGYTNDSSGLDAAYNLFFWVYNPTCETINTGKGITAYFYFNNPDKVFPFELRVVNCTSDFRFYKLCLSNPEDMLWRHRPYTDGNFRTYNISGIQCAFGNADLKECKVSISVDFRGYSKGCDSSSLEYSTLEMYTEGLETIHLSLFHTTYRTGVYDDPVTVYRDEWGNPVEQSVTVKDTIYYHYPGSDTWLNESLVRVDKVNDYTCDAITTAYFSLPKEYFDKYKNLCQISAEWEEYKTAPIFVTSDYGAYKELMGLFDYPTNWLGEGMGQGNNDLTRRVLWEKATSKITANSQTLTSFAKTFNGKALIGNAYVDMFPSGYTFSNFWSYENRMDLLFYVKAEKTEDYKISSKILENYMKEYSRQKADEYHYTSEDLVAGQFYLYLFEQEKDWEFVVDEGRQAGKNYLTKLSTDIIQGVEIEGNDNRSWWEKLWNTDIPTEYRDIEPIYVFTDQDIKTLQFIDENNAEDVAWFEKHYYIENDNTNSEMGSVIKELKRMVDRGEVPVLFRFAVTDYYSAEAWFDNTDTYFYTDEGEYKFDGTRGDITEADGYVAQETVFLNFDIISLGFENEFGQVTVLPVVADPINIISGLIPPENLTVENDEWWQKLVMILMLIVLLVILSPILTPILTVVLTFTFNVIAKAVGAIGGFLWKIITAPIRFVAWLFRRC